MTENTMDKAQQTAISKALLLVNELFSSIYSNCKIVRAGHVPSPCVCVCEFMYLEYRTILLSNL